MAQDLSEAQVEVVETIGLIPHPTDASHPPIEPYISDVLPDLLANYEWLGMILAIFESDQGLSTHPEPPTIHVYEDEDRGWIGLPITEDPITSHRAAESWLERHWQNPRYDFNVNRLAPQLVLGIGDHHYLVVTIELEKPDIGRLMHNERWTDDLGRMRESSLEYKIVKAVATDYMS